MKSVSSDPDHPAHRVPQRITLWSSPELRRAVGNSSNRVPDAPGGGFLNHPTSPQSRSLREPDPTDLCPAGGHVRCAAPCPCHPRHVSAAAAEPAYLAARARSPCGPARAPWRAPRRSALCSRPRAAGGGRWPAALRLGSTAHRKPAPANVRPFYNPLVSHNRPGAFSVKPPASPPSCLFLEPTARKTFFFFFLFKGKVEKAQQPSAGPTGVSPSLPFSLSRGSCDAPASSGPRRGLSCPAPQGRVPAFVLSQKETHSNDGPDGARASAAGGGAGSRGCRPGGWGLAVPFARLAEGEEGAGGRPFLLRP